MALAKHVVGVNGVAARVPMTVGEETATLADWAAYDAAKAAADVAPAPTADQKLSALGLSSTELGAAIIKRFDAVVSFASVTGAAISEQNATVTGLLATDRVIAVVFPSGLLPTTIGLAAPPRVSAANTLTFRFFKIATGAVTPAANQALSVYVLR